MKHLSLFKIFVALLICNIYLFTCAVMGTVGDSSLTDPAVSEPVDSGAQGEGTIDFLPTTDDPAEQPGGLPENLFTLSFKAPTLAQRPFSSGYEPSDRIQKISAEDPAPSSSSGSSSTPGSSSKPQSSSGSSSTPHSSLSSSTPQPSSS